MCEKCEQGAKRSKNMFTRWGNNDNFKNLGELISANGGELAYMLEQGADIIAMAVEKSNYLQQQYDNIMMVETIMYCLKHGLLNKNKLEQDLIAIMEQYLPEEDLSLYISSETHTLLQSVEDIGDDMPVGLLEKHHEYISNIISETGVSKADVLREISKNAEYKEMLNMLLHSIAESKFGVSMLMASVFMEGYSLGQKINNPFAEFTGISMPDEEDLKGGILSHLD